MKELPFNLHDVGIIPEVFCKLCQVRIVPVVHRAESGESLGFWIRHPKNDCRHDGSETVMPIISLAELCLKLKA